MKDEKLNEKEVKKAAKRFFKLLERDKLYKRIKAINEKTREEE